MEQGKKAGYLFSIGVCVVIAIQAFISLEFASIIKDSPFVEKYIQIVGCIIFFILSIYFFSLGKGKKPEESSKSFNNPLLGGAVLAFLNIFSYTFYAGVGLALNYAGWLNFSPFEMTSFSFGSALGSFGFLFIIANSAEWIASKITLLTNNINYILGGITGFVAILTLISLF